MTATNGETGNTKKTKKPKTDTVTFGGTAAVKKGGVTKGKGTKKTRKSRETHHPLVAKFCPRDGE